LAPFRLRYAAPSLRQAKHRVSYGDFYRREVTLPRSAARHGA